MALKRKAVDYSTLDNLFEERNTRTNKEWDGVLSDIAAVTSDLNEKLDNGYKDWGNVQRLYKEVFNIINVPMVLMNDDIVVCANKAFCKKMEVNISDVFHKNISSVVHPDSQHRLCENNDCVIKLKNGKQKWKNTHVACSPITIDGDNYTLLRVL